MKKHTEDDVDIYTDKDVEIVDMRDNRDVAPTVAVEVKDGKSQVVCLICKKTYGADDGAIQEFMNHKCEQKGDEKLV